MPELFGLPCVYIISGIAGYIFVIVSPAIFPAILLYKPYFLQHPQEPEQCRKNLSLQFIKGIRKKSTPAIIYNIMQVKQIIPHISGIFSSHSIISKTE